MSARQLHAKPAAEERCVVRWRLDQLRQAGYDRRTALRIASRTDVDLHVATDLVARGCPVETAIRILL